MLVILKLCNISNLQTWVIDRCFLFVFFFGFFLTLDVTLMKQEKHQLFFFVIFIFAFYFLLYISNNYLLRYSPYNCDFQGVWKYLISTNKRSIKTFLYGLTKLIYNTSPCKSTLMFYMSHLHVHENIYGEN